MRCFTRRQAIQTGILAGSGLCIGGFFSSLRGAVKTITPADNLQAAVSSLQPGDTLYLKAGSYGNIVSSPSGSSWASPVLIASFPGEVATLRSVGLTASERYVVFKDLALDAQKVANSQCVYLGIGTHHTRFQGCDIRNGGFCGVVTQTNGTQGSHEFLGCKVHDNGSNPRTDHGFYLQCPNNLIDGCEVYNNAAYGVQIQGAGSGNVVTRCRVYRNSRVGEGGGIVLNGVVSNSLVANCLIYLNGGNGAYAGVQISGWGVGNTGNRLFYCTIYSNNPVDAGGVQYFGTSGVQIRDNIIWANGGVPIRDSGNNSGATISNNLSSADPMFVNAGGGDFHLRPGSPAIGAGVAVGVTTDYDGRARGNPPSVGAYEGVVGSSTPPPAPTSPDVTQLPPVSQPPVYQQQPPPSTSQPSGPSTSQVAVPFLIAGVIGAALLLGGD